MPNPYVNLIFRANNDVSFSIEKVFQTLLPIIKREVETHVVYAPQRGGGITGILKNLFFLKKIRGSIYHITGDIHYAVFAFPRKRTMLTIHDCVFLENSNGFKRYILKKLWLEWPVAYVNTITTISEKSKNEIITYTNCNPSKIRVISNPVSETIFFTEKQFNQKQPVILFVGTKPNKNLERSLEALQNIPCRLEIIGKLNNSQMELIRQYGISANFHINISDSEVAKLYSSSDIVLFPSLYEGFGLPVLEAQKAGRAVITSNISPMLEVSAGAACLIDPYNVNSIRDGVLKIIEDQEYRNHLVESGKKNVQQYQGKIIADKYVSLYQEMCEV